MAFSSRVLLLLCVLLERTTVDENDIVTAVLNNPDAQDALRVIARIAIREVALRANTALPVEDVTVIGKMTIDRLRRTVTVKGQVRPIKPREFALLETLARRPGIVLATQLIHRPANDDRRGLGLAPGARRRFKRAGKLRRDAVKWLAVFDHHDLDQPVLHKTVERS
jgi:hypothetical protein